jgi:hypothetical protein
MSGSPPLDSGNCITSLGFECWAPWPLTVVVSVTTLELSQWLKLTVSLWLFIAFFLQAQLCAFSLTFSLLPRLSLSLPLHHFCPGHCHHCHQGGNCLFFSSTASATDSSPLFMWPTPPALLMMSVKGRQEKTTWNKALWGQHKRVSPGWLPKWAKKLPYIARKVCDKGCLH